MNLQRKIEKIEQDIDVGIKFKSANRLRNLINQYPNEIFIWERLAELYYESGFYDAAGKYWIFTPPTEDRIKKCVDIYLKSVNYSGTQVLRDITFRGDKSKLPEYAKTKLLELEANSRLKSNHVPTFKPWRNEGKNPGEKHKPTFRDRLLILGVVSILLLIVFCLFVGFITVVSWLF